MEGLEHSNVFLTSSNPVVMTQLSQITATIIAMHTQLKTLSYAAATRPKNKVLLLELREQLLPWEQSIQKKSRHKYETYHKNILGAAKRGVNDG